MAAADSSALWRLVEESQFWKHIEPTLERIVLDPKYHDALTLVKGMRNGIVYGTKVRFPHALVYVCLYLEREEGSISQYGNSPRRGKTSEC